MRPDNQSFNWSDLYFHVTPLDDILVIICKINEFSLPLLQLTFVLLIIVLVYLLHPRDSHLGPCYSQCLDGFWLDRLIARLAPVLESSLVHIKFSKTLSHPWYFALITGLAVVVGAFSLKIDPSSHSQMFVLRVVLAKIDCFFVLHIGEVEIILILVLVLVNRWLGDIGLVQILSLRVEDDI